MSAATRPAGSRGNGTNRNGSSRNGDGRVPPHNLDAEESLLGAMLLSRDAVMAAAEVGLTAADLYKPAHGHIFDAVVRLWSRGEPADPVTVADDLARRDLLELVGGPGELLRLQAGTPSTSNAARYARIVTALALLRRLIAAGGNIAELGYSLPDDVERALDEAEASVFAVAERRIADTMATGRQLADTALARLEVLEARGDTIVGLPTGFADLDDLLLGLHPSQLVVVGARPSMGKTAFALALATHAAVTVGRPVLLFSLEMSREEISQRLLALLGRVDLQRLRNGRLSAEDWPKVSLAVARLSEAPLHVDDNPAATVLEIRAKARRLRARLGDLALVVVDYLQLLNGRASAENRQVEVAEMSRQLKILARELDVPVLVLSQLSRQLEQRADKRPMLSDLRESGSQEQDADVVAFLYRDEVYHPDSPDRGAAEVIVAKHRSGPTGSCKLVWRAASATFANMARSW